MLFKIELCQNILYWICNIRILHISLDLLLQSFYLCRGVVIAIAVYVIIITNTV